MPPEFRRPTSKKAGSNSNTSGSPARPGQAKPNLSPGRNGPPQLRYVPAPKDWQHCRSVGITLTRLPERATTWNIWEALSGCGNIVYIEIFDDRQGRRKGRAVVRFEPPPRSICWPGSRCGVTVEKVTYPVTVDAQPARDEQWISTPLKNRIPATISVFPSKLCFGVLVQPEAMMEMSTIHRQALAEEREPGDDGLKLTVDFRARNITAFFPVQMGATASLQQNYKFVVKFEQITQLVLVEREGGKWAIVLALDHPPACYRKKTRVKQTHSDGNPKWTERELWARAVDICPDPVAKRDRPEKLHKDTDLINLGRWTTYWFEMDGDARAAWKTIQRALGDFNMHAKTAKSFGLIPKTPCDLWDRLETGLAATVDKSALALLADDSKVHLPFDVVYQLQTCISQGLLQEHNISHDFLQRLAGLSDPESYDPDRAKLMLEYVADQRKRVFDPMTMFDDRGAKTYFPPTISLPSHCVLMRKCTVTPTTMYFGSPTVETTNRVIRHYWNDRDHFLRVQFTDEIPLGQIFSGPETTRDNEVFARVHRVLFQGIQVGDRLYEFLAFGSSQIREAGAYFFASTNGITCDTIRSWMGMENLGHIKTVAKVAARLGQCFSTTRVVYGVRTPRVVSIPDVERNGYCFTDGVGKMSSFLARTIAQDWQLASVPSVYQFRMGGCKGILTLAPELKGPEVHIRPSQKKFDASQKVLEIIKCSQFSTASLNRQSITLLSTLGIADEVFEDMLRRQLSDYDKALQDPQAATRLLGQFVDENQMTVYIARMIADGFMEAREPFLMTLLHLWRSWSIKLLKEKAKLVVTEGAFVFGCVDETGTLRGHEAGSRSRSPSPPPLPQIFIQVPDAEERHAYKVITGLCLVGRNPSLHPGDLRVVEAVDVEALHHLRDVVVFPQQGDRDIPSMCSGGDLDGDDFFVIWDPRLIPDAKQRNQPPMDFQAPPPLVHDRPITADDLRTFFVLYMKNNSLPVIAHAHLAWADYLTPEHARHPRCTGLAALHSKAVDYVKTGEPAIMDRALKPALWPHWMEKRGRSYRSREVLGKLYDQVERVEFRPGYDMPFDQRILAAPQRYEQETLKAARRIKTQYDVALRRVMGQLEIRTEFEVWSTFVLSKPRVGSGYKLQELVGRQSYMLKQQYRAVCEQAAGGRDFAALAPFVAAMYRVTWEEVQIALHEAARDRPRQLRPECMPLISFPWLFDTVLGRVATGRDEGGLDLAGQGLDATAKQASALRPPKRRGPGDEEPAMAVETAIDAPETGGELLDVADMEWERTKDGKIIHRGQVLRLFWDDDDDDDDDDNNDKEELAHGADLGDGNRALGLDGGIEVPPLQVSVRVGATLETPSSASDAAVQLQPEEEEEEDLIVLFDDKTTSEGREPATTADGGDDEDEIQYDDVVLDETETETALDRAAKLGL